MVPAVNNWRVPGSGRGRVSRFEFEKTLQKGRGGHNPMILKFCPHIFRSQKEDVYGQDILAKSRERAKLEKIKDNQKPEIAFKLPESILIR